MATESYFNEFTRVLATCLVVAATLGADDIDRGCQYPPSIRITVQILAGAL